ncbi:AAA family ATPase [Flavobacterium chungbukense]|uniref:AAA family ATPase n=1 Tax=Flavobacterium chungbukense TaxID=877464 RepID=A0ABP7YVR3_9FLAO|nr:AAA family ATPase [Flavobacterium chungbukense]MCC4923266.1 ATP-binding protein [Flavobacterium chungbukense]
MEIIYLFIKNFNSLKNQGINFGSEYKFDFNTETSTLTTVKNELYIPYFYNYNTNETTVLNLSTIIGKNGTGKSSILEFITKNFTAGQNLHDECIVVYKTSNIYNLITTQEINYDKNIIKNIEVLKNKEFDDDKLSEFLNLGYNFRGFPQTDFIYFSNIFDGTPSENINGLHNISTNCLIFEDHNFARLQKTILPNNANQIGVHLIEDIFRQVRFITDEISKDKLSFKLPETLDISLNTEYLLNDKVFDNNDKIQKTFLSFKRNFENDYNYGTLNTLDTTVNKFVSYVLLNLIKELLSISSSLSEMEYSFNFEYSSDFHLSSEKIPFRSYPFRNAVQLFFEAVEKKISKNKVIIDLANSILLNTKEFVNLILENESELKQVYYNNENGPTLAINVENKNLLDNFFSLYLKTFSVNPYLKFIWRKLSSGEKALLNIYSRFFSLSDQHKFGNKLADNIIILIDEGDVYLHPSWQKKFVKNILEYLPIIFKSQNNRKRNLQIIFTTNSPIPASDVLNYNTVFLDKVVIEKNGNIEFKVIVKDSLNDQKENFAANIHTLLSDSFFVKNGLIGEFASSKLNQIIDKLTKRSELNNQDRENMRRLIHQIGEPILKHKLLQMYNDRFNMEIHERLDKIEKKLGL